MTYYKFLHIKGILFVAIILLSSFCISNSKIDSLENLLKEATGETKLAILNKLAYKYRLSNPDSTIEYGFEALNMAESLKNLKEKHAALSNIGMGYRYLGKYNDALECQQKALEVALLMDNEKNVAAEYNRIGIIYKRLGLYSLALEYYLKALNIREKLNDKSGISDMYNNIGNVYRKRGDLDLALEYYFKTLKIENVLEDKEGYAYILNNIGNVYSDLKMYDKSLEYHKESLKVKEQLGNKYGIATSIRNIGEIYLNLNKPQRSLEYFEKQLELATEINDINGIAAAKTDIGRVYIVLKDYTKAEKYLEESLEIIEKTGDKAGIIHACVSFSSFYIELGEYEKAIKFLESSLEMAKEEEFMENLRDIYLNYSVIYSNINKPTKALDYYKKYTAIKDSIFNSEISSKITELQIQRTSEELEKEKTLLEEKNTFQQLLLAKKNQLIYALIAITILIFILIILVYNRFLNKQRIEKKLREANATKDKFFSIIAHDLSNPFNSIMGFANLLHLEYDYHSDEEKRLMIDNLYKVSENTYKLLQNLLEWAKTQTNNLNFIPEVLDLREITNENIKIFHSVANSKNIKVNSELNGEIEVVGDKNMVKTILRNLISNAIKFTPDGGFVNISASKKKKNVEICVKDNGTGIKPEDLKKLFTIDDHLHSKGTANENGSGLGLILCKEFVEINRGKIWARSQYGKESKFIFTLPSN